MTKSDMIRKAIASLDNPNASDVIKWVAVNHKTKIRPNLFYSIKAKQQSKKPSNVSASANGKVSTNSNGASNGSLAKQVERVFSLKVSELAKLPKEERDTILKAFGM